MRANLAVGLWLLAVGFGFTWLLAFAFLVLVSIVFLAFGRVYVECICAPEHEVGSILMFSVRVVGVELPISNMCIASL